jgi:tyrosine-protein phosphatase SIW14
MRPVGLKRVFFCVFVIALYTGLALAAESSPAGVPNFHKIDHQVYRGAQPTVEGFGSLAKFGVKSVLDLRELGEHSQAAEEAIVRAQGMRYFSIPLKKMGTPSAEAIYRILGLLNDPSAGPVFVHCKRGADRTGAVIACYRVSHDSWSNSQALAEARDDGMSVFQRSLRRYVKQFAPIPPASPAPALAPALAQ